MLDSDYKNKNYLENGYLRNSDGSLFISTITNLGVELNGEMFDWWFRNCDDSNKYKWWHPKDHISGTWDDSYFNTPSIERKNGYYINHSHIVEEKIDNISQKLKIKFLDPSNYLDVNKFKDNNITACLIARVYTSDDMIGNNIGVGYLLHMVTTTTTNGGNNNTLTSKFWLGHNVELEENDYYSNFYCNIINFISNTKLFKYIKLPNSIAKGLYIHCYEEMNCLKSFLPDFYNNNLSL